MSERHISEEEVRHVARLARLALNDDELQSIGRDLNAILDYVDKLAELDLTGVEPTTHAVPLELALRQDVVVKTLTREDVLANAPSAREGLFCVPRAVEGGN